MAESIEPSARKHIVRELRRQREKLADGWVARHGTLKLSAAATLEQLDNGWDEYRRKFALPLLYVLEKAIATGQAKYFYIYSAQRLRFFSTALRKQGAQAELSDMLRQDTEEMVRSIEWGRHGPARPTLTGLLDAVHAPLSTEAMPRTIKMAFVGDCALSEILSFLYPILDEAGIKTEAHAYYFSARLQRELNTAELENGIKTVGFDLIALSFLTFEGLPLYTGLLHEAASSKASATELTGKCDALLAIIGKYVSAIREKTNTPILLHGCSGLPLTRLRGYLPFLPALSKGQEMVTQRLDDGLAAMANGLENVVFIDERTRTRAIGLRAANRRLLPRVVTRKALFHPSAFGILMADEYADIVKAYMMLAKTKVLLVDFDNTLWKGVMADGEVVHDVEGQTLLKELKEAGMLLVSLSKNDPKNIRWSELALDEADFVLHKISWDTKPQSVLEVAKQLDLDPRSFVLIDDNPVERDLVTSVVPGVTTLDPLDRRSWRFLRLLLKFPATRQTEEASRRTAMYREAALRREAQSATVDYSAMMGGLELEATWRRAERSDLERLNELVNRTNQFNTTTIRYSMPELTQLMSAADHDVFVATLKDKFGSLGVVGVSICRIDAETLTFENVVMSCRAMGFGLETLLVRGALDEHRGARRAIGRYIPTERNNPCAELFSSCGFVQDGENTWVLDLAGTLPEIPGWLSVQRSKPPLAAVAA